MTNQTDAFDLSGNTHEDFILRAAGMDWIPLDELDDIDDIEYDRLAQEGSTNF